MNVPSVSVFLTWSACLALLGVLNWYVSSFSPRGMQPQLIKIRIPKTFRAS
jgi:hypothetical protein